MVQFLHYLCCFYWRGCLEAEEIFEKEPHMALNYKHILVLDWGNKILYCLNIYARQQRLLFLSPDGIKRAEFQPILLKLVEGGPVVFWT